MYTAVFAEHFSSQKEIDVVLYALPLTCHPTSNEQFISGVLAQFSLNQ